MSVYPRLLPTVIVAVVVIVVVVGGGGELMGFAGAIIPTVWCAHRLKQKQRQHFKCSRFEKHFPGKGRRFLAAAPTIDSCQFNYRYTRARKRKREKQRRFCACAKGAPPPLPLHPPSTPSTVALQLWCLGFYLKCVIASSVCGQQLPTSLIRFWLWKLVFNQPYRVCIMLTDSNGEVIHLSSHEVLFSSLKSVSNGSDWLRAFSVSCWLIPLDDQSHPIRINDQWDAPLLPSNLTSCHVQIQKENWWLNSWWKFFLMDHGRAPLIRVPIKPLIYCVLTEANHQHEPVRRADRLHTGKPIRHPLSELLELFHRYLMTTMRWDLSSADADCPNKLTQNDIPIQRICISIEPH